MKASRNLKPTAVDAQEAARIAKENEIFATCDTAIETIFKAQGNAAVAQGLADEEHKKVTGAREAMMIFLAKAAHTGNYNAATSEKALMAAMTKYYLGNNSEKKLNPTQFTMKSELLLAMHPKVRGNVEKIVTPWIAAWDADDPSDKAKQPMRTKFHQRSSALAKAFRLAIGEEAVEANGRKTAKAAVPSVVCDTPASVLAWVEAAPKVTRAPKPATNNAAPTIDPSLSERDKAVARVDQLVVAVKAVAADYPGAKDLFNNVLKGLAACTSDRLVPLTAPAPTPAPTPAPAADPVDGVSDIDDAMSDDDAISAMLLARYKARLAAK